MASRVTKGRDTRVSITLISRELHDHEHPALMVQLEAFRTTPTSRPAQPESITKATAASSTKRKQWVNPGPPPKPSEMSDNDMWFHAQRAGVSKDDFPTWKITLKQKLALRDEEDVGPIIGVRALSIHGYIV